MNTATHLRLLKKGQETIDKFWMTKEAEMGTRMVYNRVSGFSSVV